MPTPDAKLWSLLCMSCPCAVIRGHRLRQAHIFRLEVKGSIAGRMQIEIFFSEFFSICRCFSLYLCDQYHKLNLADYIYFRVTAMCIAHIFHGTNLCISYFSLTYIATLIIAPGDI